MKENPYARFQEEKLILRDELAIDRTILANERTILAYFRSALTLVIVGLTFVHFFEKGILPYIGMAFIPCGLIVGIWGYRRYRKMDASIRLVRKTLSPTSHDTA
ncbi:MAG: DUF202 domain-containing protein [Syntrophaceae bacterium]|nr:DUF202 domain-containing protein [Syntrophaceae bacterium]